MRGAAIALGLIALVGCDPGPCGEVSRTEPDLQIGTGSNAFVPLGDVMEFVRGPQGGYHVFGSLRADGVWAGNPGALDDTLPLIAFTVSDTSGTLTAGYDRSQRPMEQVTESLAERVGDLLILPITEPSQAEGVTVTLSAEIEDACGTVVRQQATSTLTEGVP